MSKNFKQMFNSCKALAAKYEQEVVAHYRSADPYSREPSFPEVSLRALEREVQGMWDVVQRHPEPQPMLDRLYKAQKLLANAAANNPNFVDHDDERAEALFDQAFDRLAVLEEKLEEK